MIAKHRRAVRPREDRLGHVAPHLAPVDVPRRDNLNIPRPVTAQIPVQKPDRLIRPAVRIMRHAMHQRTREVPNPDDRYLDAHEKTTSNSCTISASLLLIEALLRYKCIA